nr:non-specific lipid-transfer protein 1-like [Ipomoea batatas]
MAVVVGNGKQLTSLLLLCIITTGVMPPWAEAQISCSDIINSLLPCMNYVLVGGSIPEECCKAMKSIVNNLKTKVDRQSACECMKAGVSRLTADQLNRVQAIPGYCKVGVPFKISPDVDCSAVQKRIN